MDEATFLEAYDPAAFAHPSMAVDLVLLGLHRGQPAALLQRREDHPFIGHWALPGGFVAIDEDLEAAARRVLHDRARIADAHLEQLYTFGRLDRDPRTRVITVAWLALLEEAAFSAALAQNPTLIPAALSAPAGARQVAVSGPEGPLALAFDHAEILTLALHRLRGKLDYSEVGFALLPAQFTLRQLQDVHEGILGLPLNKPAFRRRMLDRGWLTPTGLREEGTSYRPAELYRYNRPA